jgi:hypothetical protein
MRPPLAESLFDRLPPSFGLTYRLGGVEGRAPVIFGDAASCDQAGIPVATALTLMNRGLKVTGCFVTNVAQGLAKR